MDNKDNTSEKEKGKTSLMIADDTRRVAKLSLYHLKIQNAEAGLGIISVISSSIRRGTDRIGDGRPRRRKNQWRRKKSKMGHLSLLSAQLEPSRIQENGDRGLAVVTRSGKVAIGKVQDIVREEDAIGGSSNPFGEPDTVRLMDFKMELRY
uniref:Uncharacterized protein n=1 Tax=Solanum tuberosum TaxID=4113 RepID=M1DTP0_SOLTU